jgi:hypothetical protein
MLMDHIIAAETHKLLPPITPSCLKIFETEITALSSGVYGITVFGECIAVRIEIKEADV